MTTFSAELPTAGFEADKAVGRADDADDAELTRRVCRAGKRAAGADRGGFGQLRSQQERPIRKRCALMDEHLSDGDLSKSALRGLVVVAALGVIYVVSRPTLSCAVRSTSRFLWRCRSALQECCWQRYGCRQKFA